MFEENGDDAIDRQVLGTSPAGRAPHWSREYRPKEVEGLSVDDNWARCGGDLQSRDHQWNRHIEIFDQKVFITMLQSFDGPPKMKK